MSGIPPSDVGPSFFEGPQLYSALGPICLLPYTMNTNRLTSTRFFAAMCAVLFHTTWAPIIFGGSRLWGLLANGPVAVTYFFCLSGFVMAHAYSPDNIKPVQYWINRIARIYPLYIIALIWLCMLVPQKPWAFEINAAMIQTWLSGWAMSGNIPGWSISTEFSFYLAFPLFILALTSKRLPFTTIVVAAFWLASQCLHHWVYVTYYPSHPYPSIVHDLLFYMPPFHFNEFLLGAVFGAWSKRNSRTGYMFDVVSILTAAAIAYSLSFGEVLARHGVYTTEFVSGGLAPLMLTFIYSLPRAKGIWTKFFELRPMVLLGEASYAIYILQIPVLYTAIDYKFFDLIDLLWPQIGPWKIVSYVLLLTAVAIMAFVAIETPARKAIRSLGKSDRLARA